MIQQHVTSAITSKQRRQLIWNLIITREGGLAINQRCCYNTKDTDIRWILKHKPVKLVRRGLKRSRTTYIVAI